MKKLLCVTLVLAAVFSACKKEKKFMEPEYIFAKWARAIDTLNYADYRACEAFPKSEPVFREMFRDTYYADLMVTGVEKLDEKNIKKDTNGVSYMGRNVHFECTEYRRKDRKAVRVLRGDVDFIKYADGDRQKRGWLMWNRKIIRIER